MLLLLLACSLFQTGPQPEVITVVRGDTLGKLAKTHGVTVAELKQWNGLSSDLIEVGQELKIFREGEAAPSPTPKKRRPGKRPSSPGPQQGGTADGPEVPNLSMPRAKKCLSGPDGSGVEEEGMVASQGLSAAEVQGAMNAFLPKVSSCLVGFDASPTQALHFSISVGCDGRVTHVGIVDGGDWQTAHADCLQQALRYAAFPAHALPDGDTFEYPLRLQ